MVRSGAIVEKCYDHCYVGFSTGVDWVVGGALASGLLPLFAMLLGQKSQVWGYAEEGGGSLLMAATTMVRSLGVGISM